MQTRIRAVEPEADYPRVAELLNTFERQVITADMLHQWDKRVKGDAYRRRMAAVNANGEIVGYSVLARDTWDPPHFCAFWVLVDPACRGQGIGTQLYEDAWAAAQERGATLFSGDVLDYDPISKAFAEKRGFHVRRHMFESTIDLKTFDERPFVQVLDEVRAGGIRLFSLAEAGNSDDNLYKLWQVNYQTYLDDPASTGAFPNFDEFRSILRSSEWFRPEGQLLAADGDQYVGLAAVGYYKDSNSAYNMMTGVMPEYRGRKIAQALKLLTIRAAKNWGADFIRTNNDSTNAPMLSINYKLGYVPQPGIYRMARNLNG